MKVESGPAINHVAARGRPLTAQAEIVRVHWSVRYYQEQVLVAQNSA